MKGQLIFEFIIAGLIFFALILYTVNYLNASVSDFSGKFYQNRLQSKAVQMAEILVSGDSGLGIADDRVFIPAKIQQFNATYCSDANYRNLVKDFYLYEATAYGVSPNNAKISLSTDDGMLLDCGMGMPRNVTKADIERIGLYQNRIARLSVTVW